MNLILLGPQGSGKGTQAKLLANKLKAPHISTGDIFRQNITNKTELGLQVKAILDAGKLVPDEVTDNLIKNRLKEPDCAKGYILDGYPRNLHQAKALDKISKVAKVVNLQISDEEVMKRISGRRSCPKCKKVYHIVSNPSPNGNKCSCGTILIIRDDDKPEVIAIRLKLYHELTEPIIEYYRKKKVLVDVDGTQAIDVVLAEIINKLNIVA